MVKFFFDYRKVPHALLEKRGYLQCTNLFSIKIKKNQYKKNQITLNEPGNKGKAKMKRWKAPQKHSLNFVYLNNEFVIKLYLKNWKDINNHEC